MEKDNTSTHFAVDLEKQRSVAFGADDCVSVEDDSKHQWSKRDFRVILSSNVFFFIASALYLWLAVMDLQWVNQIQGVPLEVVEADDDVTYREVFPDDDVVFQTPNSNVNVSQYMIVYFCAAFCYVVTGLLECLFEEGCFGIFLLLAGLFGLISSLFVEKDEDVSNTFDLVSSNLFLLEALLLFFRRHSFTGAARLWYRLADGLFLLGALSDVIISYITKFADVTYSHKFSTAGVFDCCLWMVSALIYLTITIHWRAYHTPESWKADDTEKHKTLDRKETEESA